MMMQDFNLHEIQIMKMKPRRQNLLQSISTAVQNHIKKKIWFQRTVYKYHTHTLEYWVVGHFFVIFKQL
eukprot:06714.XXX_38446_38652_1 [CDS] Oithona nana genome sequencing.